MLGEGVYSKWLPPRCLELGEVGSLASGIVRGRLVETLRVFGVQSSFMVVKFL